jgi:predicted nucleotidyltransferase component of viral defense system
MNKWFIIPESTKSKTYIQIAEETGMASFAVEKDWWVVQTLSIIFEMKVSEYLVFKGGTSLSKAWNLIDRFSEDVDLAIDRKFLGFEGELSKKQITALRKAANFYVSEIS